MKQIIVLISMIILGVAIAGFIDSFKESAEGISTTAKTQIITITEDE